MQGDFETVQICVWESNFGMRLWASRVGSSVSARQFELWGLGFGVEGALPQILTPTSGPRSS